MTRRRLVVAFEREEHLLAAVRHARGGPHALVDVHAPYPVHGLPEAQGLSPSRLPVACFLFAALGLAAGLLLQVWTSAVDWPLDVGGKPLVSMPAFVPVAFELVILFAGLGTVAAFLVASRLRPSRRPRSPSPRATDDRFFLTLEARGAEWDAEALGRLHRDRFGACAAEEILVEEAP